MGRDRKGKGKASMKDTKQKLTGIKEVDELEVRIKYLEEIFSNLRNRKLKQKDLINYLSTRDIQWQLPKNTQEEQPKQLYVPIKTEEEEPLPLHIVYPHSHFALSTWGTNTRDAFPDEIDMEKDEVVFNKGHFEYDPLRYVNGSVSCVSAFTHDKDVFPRCLNHIMSEIDERKWALFYRIPKKKLLDKEWEEDDAGLRWCSSTPFDTRYKRKTSKSKKTYVIHDEGSGRKRKKSLVNGGNKGKEKVFEDEGADKKRKKTLVTGGSKGKEKVFEDEVNQGVVTIYKRAMVNGKSKMVEVEGAVKTGRDRGVVIGGKEEVVKVESE
ncbi:hypothetical protein Tco_1384666 [Tanacetum coccineum]